LVGLGATTLEAVDRKGNTALHLACRGAKYETIALLLDKYDAVSVSKRNANEKLPIDLLWESDVRSLIVNVKALNTRRGYIVYFYLGLTPRL
jgi:ankyrin repeat protein